MGLLDNILGSASGGGGNTQKLLLMGLLAMVASRSAGQAQGKGDLLGSLGGALGGLLGGGASGGGLGGLLAGALGGGKGAQSSSVSPMALVGTLGGLGGLTQMLQSGGLGDAVQSWIGTGENKSVSAEQVTQAFAPGGQLQQLASIAGISQGEAAQQLSALLPQVIDHLTPGGNMPQGQFDLASLAQQFLGK